MHLQLMYLPRAWLYLNCIIIDHVQCNTKVQVSAKRVVSCFYSDSFLAMFFFVFLRWPDANSDNIDRRSIIIATSVRHLAENSFFRRTCCTSSLSYTNMSTMDDKSESYITIHSHPADLIFICFSYSSTYD